VVVCHHCEYTLKACSTTKLSYHTATGMIQTTKPYEYMACSCAQSAFSGTPGEGIATSWQCSSHGNPQLIGPGRCMIDQSVALPALSTGQVTLAGSPCCLQGSHPLPDGIAQLPLLHLRVLQQLLHPAPTTSSPRPPRHPSGSDQGPHVPMTGSQKGAVVPIKNTDTARGNNTAMRAARCCQPCSPPMQSNYVRSMLHVYSMQPQDNNLPPPQQ
jgi:hypothetical protein